jgi:hypothetical protein
VNEKEMLIIKYFFYLNGFTTHAFEYSYNTEKLLKKLFGLFHPLFFSFTHLENLDKNVFIISLRSTRTEEQQIFNNRPLMKVHLIDILK